MNEATLASYQQWTNFVSLGLFTEPPHSEQILRIGLVTEAPSTSTYHQFNSHKCTKVAEIHRFLNCYSPFRVDKQERTYVHRISLLSILSRTVFHMEGLAVWR